MVTKDMTQRLVQQMCRRMVCPQPAAAVMIDAVMRMVPGVLGDADSAGQDSFMEGLLDHPHYTRPETVEELDVPPVLLSGDHGAIEDWRRSQVRDAPAPGTVLSSPPLSSQEDTPA